MFFHPRMVGNCGGQLVFWSVMDFISLCVCSLWSAICCCWSISCCCISEMRLLMSELLDAGTVAGVVI